MTRTLEMTQNDCPFFFEPLHQSAAARAQQFAEMWDRSEENPNQTTIDAVKELAQYELTRYCVPEAFGGSRLDVPMPWTSSTLIRETLAVSALLILRSQCMGAIRSALGYRQQKGVITGYFGWWQAWRFRLNRAFPV